MYQFIIFFLYINTNACQMIAVQYLDCQFVGILEMKQIYGFPIVPAVCRQS